MTHTYLTYKGEGSEPYFNGFILSKGKSTNQPYKYREDQSEVTVDLLTLDREETKMKSNVEFTNSCSTLSSLRQDVTQCYKDMTASLDASRKRQGKSTDVHHYCNESKLVNIVVTGVRKIHRDSLDIKELVLMKDVMQENTKLLANDLFYIERKARLMLFAAKDDVKV